MGDSTIDEQLQRLARGPSITIMQYQGYEINGYIFYTRMQDEKSTNQNIGVRTDAIGNDGKQDSYCDVIEEIWKLDYGPLKIALFRCQWVNRAGGGVTTDRYGMTIIDLKKIGYKDKPFVLAKDVTQVFYVKNITSKSKKDISSKSKNDEPKCHIILLGKRKIIGVEDISDKLEYFDQFDDAPYLRRDHNQGTFVKWKIINIPLNNDE
jgi:hypothetical protein